VKYTLFSLAFLAFLALAGCNEKSTQAEASSRYQAVKAVGDPAAHWCDTSFTGAAPRLTLPPLAAPKPGTDPATLPKGKRVWVNLWATWCQPCLREMPLLLKWQEDLRKDGVDVDVLFLSLDEEASAFDSFIERRKDIATAKFARVASQHDYEQWVKAFMKDPSTPIPIHMLATADGSLRCIRSGSLREGDYPAAKSVLR
jgi:thiol-disulfide isomerase/thioredoxin